MAQVRRSALPGRTTTVMAMNYGDNVAPYLNGESEHGGRRAA
jgi:hypothetical protein